MIDMNSKRIITGFFIVGLLLALVFSTYSWWKCQEEKRDMLVSVYLGIRTSVLTLEDMGGLLEYQLQKNASERILMFYVWDFRDNAWAVENAFWILYKYSGEEKFWMLRVGMENLADFLNTVLNSPPGENVRKIQENLETLKKFDALFKELRKYRDPFDIPEELAENFSRISRELKW
ncbi:hypothetical protein [Pyrococcus abyssi]|uniref:Uncharacterized protein n=1 Tax=Pyrococcus abyssi (strain GE5 / Orsay) TaxID=272844 RepID=Q9V1L8_PYRAB|nr:hypothetical protein [Pyrococcus abyssi]CAB49331.1 Hypothetical protein PAB0275 [Pyrococcus abyssi GE5]CCE69789.1 TPA: hypothetical protein PAB0275 [Pyrococcus abyssi GE5]